SARRWRSISAARPPRRIVSSSPNASASSARSRVCRPTSRPTPNTWKASGVTERALIDTGPLVALYHDADPHHKRCRAALAGPGPPFLTCSPVLPEAAGLLRKRPDGFRAIVDGFRTGVFRLLPLDAEDLPAIADLMLRYEDAGLQFADAALARLADREGI